MRENEKVLVGGLISLVIVLVPGFLIHVSPRFSGSLEGGVLGILGAVLMLATLLYPVFKRLSWLRHRVSMRAVLLLHVFAGVFGALLVLLHTGHKMESPIGIAMIVLILVILISGFVGRYYMAQIAWEIRIQHESQRKLTAAYAATTAEMAENPPETRRGRAPLWQRLAPFLLGHETEGNRHTAVLPAQRAADLVEAMADTQYAIAAQEAIKRAFGMWMAVHIVATIGFFMLLGLHIWAAVYFGLRWLV